MRTMYRAMFGLSLAALLASPAFAQGRGGRGFGGGGLSMLIANESVQKELKLDDQQVEKAKEFAEKAREKRTELGSKLEGLEGDEARTKRAEINKEMNEMAMKAFGEFLKPEQVTRIKQISHQTMGAPRTTLTMIQQSTRRRIMLKSPVSIGEGKALRVTLSYSGPAVSSLLHQVSARAKITRVS